MKKTMMTAVACLGAALGLGTMPAMAATMNTVKVNLPYATTIGKVALPAGNYSIRQVVNAGSASVLQISSDEHKGISAFVMGREVVAPKQASNQTKVVLKQDDSGNYQLQQVWVEGQDTGIDLSE